MWCWKMHYGTHWNVAIKNIVKYGRIEQTPHQYWVCSIVNQIAYDIGNKNIRECNLRRHLLRIHRETFCAFIEQFERVNNTIIQYQLQIEKMWIWEKYMMKILLIKGEYVVNRDKISKILKLCVPCSCDTILTHMWWKNWCLVN